MTEKKKKQTEELELKDAPESIELREIESIALQHLVNKRNEAASQYQTLEKKLSDVVKDILTANELNMEDLNNIQLSDDYKSISFERLEE